ncbi:MAG: 30S ribosomal protein S18 [Candidatus Omnitrophica bacterium]|nr:30S ribosomal protein S18 [Candidatus Omnitrophota bacterium]
MPPIRRIFVKKPCRFCSEKVDQVDYKDIDRIGRYVSDRGKILPSRLTGTCAKHQRVLTRAVKRARFMALLPYVSA